MVLLGASAVAAALVGGSIGLRSAQLISCDCAPSGDPGGCPCYPILGMWFADRASFAWIGASVGVTFALMQGFFLVRASRARARGADSVHALEVPAAWLAIELVEIAVIVIALTAGVPDWSAGPSIALLVGVVIALAAANEWIRRRLVAQ